MSDASDSESSSSGILNFRHGTIDSDSDSSERGGSMLSAGLLLGVFAVKRISAITRPKKRRRKLKRNRNERNHSSSDELHKRQDDQDVDKRAENIRKCRLKHPFGVKRTEISNNNQFTEDSGVRDDHSQKHNPLKKNENETKSCETERISHGVYSRIKVDDNVINNHLQETDYSKSSFKKSRFIAGGDSKKRWTAFRKSSFFRIKSNNREARGKRGETETSRKSAGLSEIFL